MRVVAVLALLGVLAVPASATAEPIPGVERAGPHSRLAWFQPPSLRPTGPKVELGFHIGSWSFSPGRTHVAIAGGRASLRIVDLVARRAAGTFDLAPDGKGVGGVTWLRRDRLLAFVRHPRATTVVSVDPLARAIVRRARIAGVVGNVERYPGGLVLRLTNRRLAVIDADGAVRTVALGALARRGGLAVDPRGTAYLVDRGKVAVVALDTLSVAYRSPPRQLAKGPGAGYLDARWLGNGRLAVSGDDYGLKIVNVRTWTARNLDPHMSSSQHASGLFLARTDADVVAYGPDGSVRWTFALPFGTWLNVNGSQYAGVCDGTTLVSVLDVRTGGTRRASGACPFLLTGRWSSF